MKEWNSPYNPFNSTKILMWSKHLEACSKDNYLTPAMVDIDPSGRCNFDCQWCNASNIIDNKRPDLPEEHWIKLADFIASWGKDTPEGPPRSACVSGGGEPFMNKATPALLERLHENGLEIGVISNASLLDDHKIDVLARTCRWVGISMDAALPETYNLVKGMKGDYFFKVCENIRKLTTRIGQLGVQNDVGFKFLLSPLNYNEIYSAALIARSLGVKDFHLRPVGYLNITKVEGEKLEYTPEMMEHINDQINMAMRLETENFRVFAVRHKFTDGFMPKKNFKRCWTIPMLPTFSADGNVYMCFDMRGRKELIMCSHYPDPSEILSFWNTEKHKKMVQGLNVNDCPRCTFSVFNEVVEQVFLKDNMCRKFL
jgi:MoaA/NifB/PqqE/SkfB family radical SAM enzyme